MEPPRKLLDVSKLTAIGWRPRIDLGAGIRQTYEWIEHPSTAIGLRAYCRQAGVKYSRESGPAAPSWLKWRAYHD
jgi:dTDP-D-glucose 4,6-dehydratase